MSFKILYFNLSFFLIFKVENEYGSYYTCDKGYMEGLRDMLKEYLGDDTVLFTTGFV